MDHSRRSWVVPVMCWGRRWIVSTETVCVLMQCIKAFFVLRLDLYWAQWGHWQFTEDQKRYFANGCCSVHWCKLCEHRSCWTFRWDWDWKERYNLQCIYGYVVILLILNSFCVFRSIKSAVCHMPTGTNHPIWHQNPITVKIIWISENGLFLCYWPSLVYHIKVFDTYDFKSGQVRGGRGT